MTLPASVAPRRTRRPNGTERRAQGVILAVALVVGTIAGLAVSPRSPFRSGSSTKTTVPLVRLAAGRTLLFAHVDAHRQTDLIVLLALQPGGRAASVVFVPATTVVQVPSLDLTPLRDVTLYADRYLLVTSVENALGVRIDDLLTVNDASLAKLLAPVRSLRVNFSAGVRLDDARGSESFAAGPVVMSPPEAQRVMLAHEADGALSHLVTVQAVFAAWFDAVHARPAVAASMLKLTTSARVLVGAAAAQTRFDTLPVDSIDSGDGQQRFQIRDADAATLVADDFAFARVSFEGRRPRVEIQNGVGTVGVTPRVARLLVPAGANVLLTDNTPGFGVATTTVVYYRDADEAAARAFARILGVGKVAKGDTPIAVVDVTVVIGHDYVVSHPQ